MALVVSVTKRIYEADIESIRSSKAAAVVQQDSKRKKKNWKASPPLPPSIVVKALILMCAIGQSSTVLPLLLQGNLAQGAMGFFQPIPNIMFASAFFLYHYVPIVSRFIDNPLVWVGE